MPAVNALHAIIVLGVVLGGSVFVGMLFRRFKQPAVVGIIFFGLLIGTILALSPQHIKSVLLSPTSTSLIDAVGEAALLLLMFMVGIELRTYGKSGEKSPLWQLVPCVVIPMVVCAAIAWPFAHRLAGSDGKPLLAWLFVGVALGVTAVPVLVLLTRDLGVPAPIPGVALRIAITADATAWALVTALVVLNKDLSAVSVTELCAGVALLVAVMFPLPQIVRRVFQGSQQGGSVVLAMFAYALAGGAATQVLGIHPAIGAVIAGLFFPAELINEASQRALATVADIIIPAFFVSAVLSVPLQTLADLFQWSGLLFLLTLTIAGFVAKFSVGLLSGRMQRWPLTASAELGVLLNCRGVSELAMASVGLQSHLIGHYAFAIIFALALLTTAMIATLYRAINTVARARKARVDVREVSRA
jgi:Kef-type K+ transport system membrane component KefB